MKYIFITLAALFLAGNALAATATYCNSCAGCSNNKLSAKSLPDGFVLVDGNCPSDYVKVAIAKSMILRDFCVTGFFYSTGGTNIETSSGTMQYTTPPNSGDVCTVN